VDTAGDGEAGRAVWEEETVTRQEHLLTIVTEECAEIAQRCTKALRFGLEQVQQDADDKPEENPERLTNRERILREYYDLRAVLGMAGIDAWENSAFSKRCEEEKARKVDRYLQRSKRVGTLDAIEAIPCEYGCGRSLVDCMSQNCPSRYEAKQRALEVMRNQAGNEPTK
jgi:hypothetical protein